MSKTKHQSPLWNVIGKLDHHINKTEDEYAKYGLLAAREMVMDEIKNEMILIGLVYDDGASSRYGYETGKQYYQDKFKKPE